MTLIICFTSILKEFIFTGVGSEPFFREAYLIYLCVAFYQHWLLLVKVELRSFRCIRSSVIGASRLLFL